MWTPAGLARVVASFAMILRVPPPIETDTRVRLSTSSRMRRAVSNNDSPEKSRSVPVRSR